MICRSHSDRQAVAVCVSCGTGVCASCARASGRGKNVCSTECAQSADSLDDAIALIAARTQRAGRATAWFCWFLGALFLVLGSLSLLGGDKFFALFMLASSAAYIFAGTWYGRISKRTSSPGAQPTSAGVRG